MADPLVYLTADEVWAINGHVLRAYGGTPLLRDRGALESAITRPQMRAYYEGSDLVDQAATLMIGLAFAHPFFDGNKRTAAIAGDAFLRLNGFRVEADGAEFGEQLLMVVETVGDHSAVEASFSAWLRNHVVPLTP